MLGLDRIYHGDCFKVMNEIDDRSIDMVLCDLPYGMTAAKWDEYIDVELLWEHYNRVIKETGTIALFSTQPFTTKLIISNEKDFRYCWYWIKNQGTNFYHAKRMPIRKVEEICVFRKGSYNPQITTGHTPTQSARGSSIGRVYHGNNKRNVVGGKTTRYPTNVLNFKCVDNYSRLHSAQKLVPLCEYLIRTYTNEGDLVLDNCAGVGTTGIACQNAGRGFILIEKDEEQYHMARERLQVKQRIFQKPTT